MRLMTGWVRPRLKPEYPEFGSFDDWFEEDQVDWMLDIGLDSFTKKALQHFKASIEDQVEESSGQKWVMPMVQVRKLWKEKGLATKMKLKVLIFLKVAGTHPCAPWVIVYHGMRKKKSRRKAWLDIAWEIVMKGYDYAVS